MTYLSTVLLLLVPLVALYFSHAVAKGSRLDEAYTRSTNCTRNVTNSECGAAKKCQSKTAHYMHNSTFCALKKAFGYACTATVQFDEPHTMCLLVCKCIDSYFRNFSTCIPRNSTATMSVVQISILIICFMLAYLEL